MSNLVETLKAAKVLVNSDGQRVGVQLSLETWEMLLSWLEDQEDQAIVATAAPSLQQLKFDREQATDWLAWEAVQDEW
jgi:hypothetical protein